MAIPYLSPAGVTTIRFKCIRNHECKELEHAKIYGVARHEPRLYNVRAFHEDSDLIVVCEGEPDLWAVSDLNIPVVGYQGAEENGKGTWEPYFSLAFRNYSQKIVIAHGDKAGRAQAKAIAGDIEGRVVYMPDKEDANSFAQNRGLSALRERLI